MAQANTTKEQLYLDENVKTIKELPHDLIRLCCSYQQLNHQFEDRFRSSQQSYQLFENQSLYGHFCIYPCTYFYSFVISLKSLYIEIVIKIMVNGQ